MIEIKVFGIKEYYPSSHGGCGNIEDCDIKTTIGQQYNNLLNFLKNRNILDEVSLTFINIDGKNIGVHKEVRSMAEVGFSMPYITINGKMRFFGSINENSICAEIISLLAESNKRNQDQ